MRYRIAVGIVGALLLAACGGEDPAPQAAATSEQPEPAVEEASPDEAAGADDEPEPDAGDVGSLLPPAAVSSPIGVVYRASGSFEETFTLIQAAEVDGERVSVFANDDAKMFVREDSLTVCAAGEPCIMVGREMFAQLGLLGGEIVDDVTAFALDVPWTEATDATIAGRAARCLAPETGIDLEEYCYDLETGIALRWRVVDEGVLTSVEAIDAFVPTDADLRPDGPVQDLREMSQQGN